MLPIPSLSQIKSAFDVAMKVIGFVKEKVEEFEPKQYGSSEVVFHRPGKDEMVSKMLHGKFPSIPGTYIVKIDGGERKIDVDAVVIEMNVLWQFRNTGESAWWALNPKDILSIEWLELVEIAYD